MGTVLRVGVRPRYWGCPVRRNFPWWRVPGNALAQVIGGDPTAPDA
jgi:hypothetical protein